jgi:hypothetical protein
LAVGGAKRGGEARKELMTMKMAVRVHAQTRKASVKVVVCRGADVRPNDERKGRSKQE